MRSTPRTQAPARHADRFRSTILIAEVHHSALKHGIDPEDITHCSRNALVIDELDDDLRLYIGPTRSGTLLEVITIARDDGSEVAIHAMTMRPKYRPLLGGE